MIDESQVTWSPSKASDVHVSPDNFNSTCALSVFRFSSSRSWALERQDNEWQFVTRISG